MKKLCDQSATVRELWQSFTVSQSSDVYEQNFSYTVRYDKVSDSACLCIDVYDRRAGCSVEKEIRLKRNTVRGLLSFDLLSFPSAVSDSSVSDMLDGTFLRFYVTDENGRVSPKSISEDRAKEILALIKPYVRRRKGN